MLCTYVRADHVQLHCALFLGFFYSYERVLVVGAAVFERIEILGVESVLYCLAFR